MKRKVFVGLTVLVVAAGLFGWSNAWLMKYRSGLLFKFSSPRVYLPVEFLKILSGEFKGLMADYLLLEAGSFLGSNQEPTEQDWKNIHRTLKYALELDPYFMQAYIYAQGNLPWDAGMYQETIDLLAISKKHRSWDWYPGYYMGFDYYYFLADYARASEEFLEAARIEGAPLLLSILGARLAMKGKRTETAIALLKTMLGDKELDEKSAREIRMRLEALQGVLTIEKAIGEYERRYGARPSRLEELVAGGILEKLPDNPYGGPYIYDDITGEVAFDKNL